MLKNVFIQTLLPHSICKKENTLLKSRNLKSKIEMVPVYCHRILTGKDRANKLQDKKLSMFSLISCKMDLSRSPSTLNLYIGKHVAEIMASESQNEMMPLLVAPGVLCERARDPNSDSFLSTSGKLDLCCRSSLMSLYRQSRVCNQEIETKKWKRTIPLPPDFYMKVYKKEGPRSKFGITFVVFQQSRSLQSPHPNSFFI